MHRRRVPRAERREARQVADEIGDVFIYLLEPDTCSESTIIQAARNKLVINGEKYPVEKAKGRDQIQRFRLTRRHRRRTTRWAGTAMN